MFCCNLFVSNEGQDDGNKVVNKDEDNESSNKNNGKGKKNLKPLEPQPSGVVDLFKGYNNKMTVVFHSLLAPHFKYEKSGGDRICMRFGDVPFGDFQKDLVELQPIRDLENGYTLIKGQFTVPVEFVRRGFRYKYVVYKQEKGECRCLWENIEDGPYMNRYMAIPHNCIWVGGKNLK